MGEHKSPYLLTYLLTAPLCPPLATALGLLLLLLLIPSEFWNAVQFVENQNNGRKNFNDMFSRFDTIPGRDGRASGDSIVRAKHMTSRGKKKRKTVKFTRQSCYDRETSCSAHKAYNSSI